VFNPEEVLSNRLGQLLEQRRAVAASRSGESTRYRFSVQTDAFSAMALEIEERFTAHIGLELRHPLRSESVVEYSLSIPARFLIKGSYSKYLHRKAMAGILPSQVIARGNKAAFAVFVERQLEEVLLPAAANDRNQWYSKGGLKKMTEGFLQRTRGPGSGRRIWALGGYVGCKALLDE
jgi:asparagine synthetase B (glutamine-hydrolysing)